MADYLNIAGRVRTTASDGVAMEAQEVKDISLNKSQQEVNADVQTELGDRYTKEETYSKEQLNNLITTPDVNYVSVVATDAKTAVTDILPATGEANTIYRVGNWDGTQYDPTMYALYAWNGSAYVCLAVRSFVGEVYDISVNHPDGQGNPTPYADLAAALGTNGANIQADIRRGGMRIQFIKGTVQSSDNKYVQYFLTKDEWSASEGDWEKINLKEEVSQLGQNVTDLEAHSAELNFLAFEDTAEYTITTAIARVVSTYPQYKKGGLKLTFNSSKGVVTYYLDNTVWSTTTTWKKILSENDYPLYNLSYIAGSATSPVEYATRDAARYAFYGSYSLFCKYGMIITYYCTADNGWVIEQYKNTAFGYTNFRSDANWVDLKMAKDHIVSDNAPYGRLINNAVKELYIPNFSYSDAALGLIRKNYNGATSRVIVIYKAGTTTVYYQFDSTYSGNGEEIIKTSNGSAYILIDWAAIADGASISAATSKNLLNSKYVDISHCPRIDNYLNGVKKSDVLGFTSLREYINFNATKGLMLDRAIKEMYLPDLTETQKNHAVFGLCRKRYGTSQQWALAIYDSSDTTTIESFASANKVDAPELMRGTVNPNNVIVFDWSEVEDGGNGLGTTSTEYLINFKYNYLTFCPHIDFMWRFNTAAFSLVDDDFVESGYTRVKALCDSLGIKCDFALIPTVDGNGNYSIPDNVLSVVQAYENEGYHFQLHPPHSGWYNSGTNTYDGRAAVESSLVKTKRAFDENHIQHDNCLVYPGSSGSNSEVIEMAEEHCSFGLTVALDYNIGIDKSRFALARLFIDTISATYTKTYWKDKILAAYNTGALLVIGCHSYNFDTSGTVDETTNSWANFAEIVTYANSLCKIRPIGYVYGKRENLLKQKI